MIAPYDEASMSMDDGGAVEGEKTNYLFERKGNN